MSVLERICTDKTNHVRLQKEKTPLARLKKDIAAAPPVRGFTKNLQSFTADGRAALIAEIKKASPSGGLIRPEFDPAALAADYAAAGAACLSVLTDAPYFQGRDEDLKTARMACTLPVLRKDFMIDIYQIYESRALGADCILLIMAMLDDITARDLYDCARDLGMDVLTEVHNRQELDRAAALGADMIGVNSRDLKTMKTDLGTARTLADLIPPAALKVAESGIVTHGDMTSLLTAGYGAFLVGESLLKQDDLRRAVSLLLQGT